MSEKIIGYVLLIFGIVVIGYSAFDVYLVFTKTKPPIQLFSFEGVSIDPSQYTPQLEVPAGMESFVNQRPANNSKIEIIPADMFNLTSNLFAHIMLMGFLGGVGSKLANLGVQLVRPVVVKLRTANPDKQKLQ